MLEANNADSSWNHEPLDWSTTLPVITACLDRNLPFVVVHTTTPSLGEHLTFGIALDFARSWRLLFTLLLFAAFRLIVSCCIIASVSAAFSHGVLYLHSERKDQKTLLESLGGD